MHFTTCVPYMLILSLIFHCAERCYKITIPFSSAANHGQYLTRDASSCSFNMQWCLSLGIDQGGLLEIAVFITSIFHRDGCMYIFPLEFKCRGTRVLRCPRYEFLANLSDPRPRSCAAPLHCLWAVDGAACGRGRGFRKVTLKFVPRATQDAGFPRGGCFPPAGVVLEEGGKSSLPALLASTSVPTSAAKKTYLRPNT